MESLSKSIHFHPRNAFENVVWTMAATLSRPQYVNSYAKYVHMSFRFHIL